MANPFKLDEAQIAEWTKRYEEAVKPYLKDDVQAVGPFQRAGQSFLLIPIIGQLGAIFYLIYQAIDKKRSAGLPTNFLLAVTPTEVRAFKYRPGRASINVKKEVAVWKREDIKVTDTADGPMTKKVTFTVTENGETQKLVCSAPSLANNPWSTKVIELLQGSGPAA